MHAPSPQQRFPSQVRVWLALCVPIVPMEGIQAVLGPQLASPVQSHTLGHKRSRS